MRLCRYRHQGTESIAFYEDEYIIPLAAVANDYAAERGEEMPLGETESLLPFLPPDGAQVSYTRTLWKWLASQSGAKREGYRVPQADVQLLRPVSRPNKLFLLAGNYAKHIEEGGGVAAERAETFPYVFMKPPTTTLTDPGCPVRIPQVSPDHIDWELELAVVIGRGGKRIQEADALQHVAGYTVINDISDRRFQPNPNRKQREKDGFFDWLHGKWHDSFCPCGPCVTSADAVSDPQSLGMQLRVNGQLHQDASTAQQIFPVAAVIEFISSFVTLEAGDIISTGTAAGVGNTTGTYLKPGDQVEAYIESIGVLRSPVEAEGDPSSGR